jgi:hypothetical protein
LESAFERISAAEMTVSRSGVREKKRPLHNPLIFAGALFSVGAFLLKKLFLGAFL